MVQCYVRDPVGASRQARRWMRLVGFSRVEIAPVRAVLPSTGSIRQDIRPSQTALVEVTDEAMSVLDDEKKWRVISGSYSIICGRNAADPQAMEATVTISDKSRAIG